MEKQAWSTKADAINQAILPALGEFAADYDIDAIADEYLEWNGREFVPAVLAQNPDMSEEDMTDELASAFWEIATDHDLKA
jgi:hypothetical protein|nr:MAG TPA: hypothetical protein [Caudoviricetes sp.]